MAKMTWQSKPHDECALEGALEGEAVRQASARKPSEEVIRCYKDTQQGKSYKDTQQGKSVLTLHERNSVLEHVHQHEHRGQASWAAGVYGVTSSGMNMMNASKVISPPSGVGS